MIIKIIPLNPIRLVSKNNEIQNRYTEPITTFIGKLYSQFAIAVTFVLPYKNDQFTSGTIKSNN